MLSDDQADLLAERFEPVAEAIARALWRSARGEPQGLIGELEAVYQALRPPRAAGAGDLRLFRQQVAALQCAIERQGAADQCDNSPGCG